MIFVRSSGGRYLDIECEYPCLIDISGVGLEVNVPRTDEGIVLYIRRLCVSLCTRWSRLRSALSEELSR